MHLPVNTFVLVLMYLVLPRATVTLVLECTFNCIVDSKSVACYVLENSCSKVIKCLDEVFCNKSLTIKQTQFVYVSRMFSTRTLVNRL